ncbi:PilZ domain-containing protein [uncultured Amaricoccus sp.]|nr:PilZ domain-containing protein [uncultured Amaricoccus sp.]
MVPERRKNPRTRMLRRGRILYRRGHGAIDCVILDLSDGGARLALNGLTRLPGAFELRLESGASFPAAVSYRQADAIGVQFLDAREDPAPD